MYTDVYQKNVQKTTTQTIERVATYKPEPYLTPVDSNQLKANPPQIKIQTLTSGPKQSDKIEFESSHQRFNEELLSQLPVDLFKPPANQTEETTEQTVSSQSKTIRSNFTYGKNSKNEKQEFKSELLGEPMATEERVRRRSHKRQITKEEFEKLKRQNSGQTVVRTVRRVSMNQDASDAVGEKKSTDETLYKRSLSPVATRKQVITRKSASKYLKLVTDEHGNKKYEMIMGNEVIRNLSPNVVKAQTQEMPTKAYTRFDSDAQKNTFLTSNQSGKTLTNQKVVSSNTGGLNSLTQNQMKTYSSHTHNKNLAHVQYSTNTVGNAEVLDKYHTYSNNANARGRFNDQSKGIKVKQTRVVRSPSPLKTGDLALRRSPQKVVVYKDGVKLTEREFNRK